jgi:hypothetical protein
MAAVNMCCSNLSSIFVNKISDKHQANCPGCIELSLELQKVRIEMLSYEKIIKMLQEELHKKELPKSTKSIEEEYVSTRSVIKTKLKGLNFPKVIRNLRAEKRKLRRKWHQSRHPHDKNLLNRDSQ